MKIKSGEKCQKAGVYVCDKCKQEITLKVGEVCPVCPKCKFEVFTLKA